MKRILAVLLLGIISLTCLTGFARAEQKSNMFTYKASASVFTMLINGQEVGTVKSAAKGLAVYDRVVEKLLNSYSNEVFIDCDVVFRELKFYTGLVSSESELEQAIEQAIVVKTNAYALLVNGEKICYVKDTETVQEVLDELKSLQAEKIQQKENSEFQEARIKEDISFEPEAVAVSLIVDKEKLMMILTQGTEEVQEYIAKEGDTLWSIAKAHKIPFSELKEANADDEDLDMIRPGDVIKLTVEKQLVTVVAREKQKETEEIPFETEVRQDNTLERGRTKVLNEGKKGKKEITYIVTTENGKEIAREKLEEKVIEEPVKRIEVKGTKVPPPPPSRSKSKSTSQPKQSTEVVSGSGKGSDVVAYAMKFLGVRYVYGANGPNAFDCSGFTCYVYRHFGINLPRTSYQQRSVGVAVSRSNLAPGDLVLFPGHVGIYIGNNKFIHASSGSRKVIITSLDSSYYRKRFIGGRRVLR